MVVQYAGRQAVLKDYTSCDRRFRAAFASLFVSREVRALKKLEGLEGFPKVIERLGPHAFVMELIPDVRKALREPAARTPDFLSRVADLVDRMHAQGVVHCDMRRASNILADSAGRPYLVDFVSCVVKGSWWEPGTWLFYPLRRSDQRALVKLKSRLMPEAMTAAERLDLEHTHWLDIGARWAGARLRDIARFFTVRER
jgi:hypothetical protein